MESLEPTIQAWIRAYGYHAVPLAVLADPAGVPWAWIFLMLLAEEGRKNIWLMLLYGFAVLSAFDHALYWIGIVGDKALLKWLGRKSPDWRDKFIAARTAVAKHRALAVIFGRYLPLVGRFMGIGAGLADVPYPKFILFDAIGAALSVFGFGLAAHFAGRQLLDEPWFFKSLPFVFVGGVAVTLLWLFLRSRMAKPAA